MIHQDSAVTEIVDRLKERALACPWVPVGVPPPQHYHKFPNGLSICFTMDILLETRYWHLSIARIPGGLTVEEIEFWHRAFFDEEPIITYPGRITAAGVSSRHFYWRCNRGVGKSSKDS